MSAFFGMSGLARLPAHADAMPAAAIAATPPLPEKQNVFQVSEQNFQPCRNHRRQIPQYLHNESYNMRRAGKSPRWFSLTKQGFCLTKQLMNAAQAALLCARLMRCRRWDEARSLAAKFSKDFPDSFVWPLLLARADAKTGRFDEALLHALTASTLHQRQGGDHSPEMTECWYAIGLAAFLAECWEPAAKALGRALEQSPDNPDIALHLGLTLQTLRRPQQAAAAYRTVLATRPDDTQSRCNLILCDLVDNRLDEAYLLLQNWPETDKASPYRALAQAALLEAEGRYADALLHLREISFAEGQDSEVLFLVHCARGKLLHAMERDDEALAEYEQATLAAPDAAPLDLCALLRMTGREEEALVRVKSYTARRGQHNLLETQRRFHIPAILADNGHAVRLRRDMQNFLADTAHMPVLGPPYAILTIPPFHLAFHGHNDRDLLRDMALFLQEHSSLKTDMAKYMPQSEPRPPARRRIGFISRHFGNHTVMSYFFRLLTALQPRLPHCLLLEFRQRDNAYRRALAAHMPLLTLPENLSAARAAVADQKLDILIYLDLGMDILTWFLAFHRLAPVQCALYGHPATTGIPNVDIFLSPAPLEPPGAQAHYNEKLRALPCLLSAFAMPETPLKQLIKRNFTQYLCPQSLFKVHPDMDTVIRRILREDTEARCAFFVSSRNGQTLALQKRLRVSLEEDFTRVDWLPQCSEQEFLAALLRADVVLDTPHFSGGATSYKALGAGVPVVTLEGEFMRGRQTAGLYRYLGINEGMELIAGNLDEYCRLALNLAHSPARQNRLRESILAGKNALLDPEPSVSELERFLRYQ